MEGGSKKHWLMQVPQLQTIFFYSNIKIILESNLDQKLVSCLKKG